MKIIHRSFRKSFELVKGNMPITQLKFLRWYGMDAEARIPSGKLGFRSQSIWQSRFRIERNTKEVGEIKLTWNGRAILQIRWPEEAITQTYHLRRRGLFKYHYELSDDYEKVIAILQPKVNWRRFSSETTIEYQLPVPENRQLELLLCCGYIISILRSRSSSG